MYYVTRASAYGYTVMYFQRLRTKVYVAKIYKNNQATLEPQNVMTSKKQLGHLQHRVLDWCKANNLEK